MLLPLIPLSRLSLATVVLFLLAISESVCPLRTVTVLVLLRRELRDERELFVLLSEMETLLSALMAMSSFVSL